MGSVTSSTFGAMNDGVVAVGERGALAAERIVRRELLAQLRVGHAAPRGARGRAAPTLCVKKRQVLVVAESPRPPCTSSRVVKASRAARCVIGKQRNSFCTRGEIVGLRPWRRPRSACAGTRRACATLGAISGSELHGRGARADHGHALVAQVVVVVPGRRVDDLAAKVVDARMSGRLGRDEIARGQHQHARGDRAACPATCTVQSLSRSS